MQEQAAHAEMKDNTKDNPLEEKTTYRIGNRSFVVESVFKKDAPDTLGSVLLRLMKSETEKP